MKKLLAFLVGLWLLLGSMGGVIGVPIILFMAFGIKEAVSAVFLISLPMFFCLVYAVKN